MRFATKLKILLTIGRRRAATRGTAAPVTLRSFVLQFVFGFNKTAYWPVHPASVITGVEYIKTGIGTAPGLSHGCYVFAAKDAPVHIGNYTIIAPNVCIAGFNHNTYDYRQYGTKGPTTIGNYCWIGMNACILPGVHLGDHTIVAAGSVVSQSFPEGYTVIAGNPAVAVKSVEKEKCVEFRNKKEYIGYLDINEFAKEKDVILKL